MIPLRSRTKDDKLIVSVDTALSYLLQRAAQYGNTIGRIYLVLCLVFPIGMTVHGIWAFVFSKLNVVPLATWDLGSSLAWGICACLLISGRAFMGPIIAMPLIEIPVRAALVTYFVGIDSGFWIFALFAPILISLLGFVDTKVRVFWGVLYSVIFAAIAAIPLFVSPVVVLDPFWVQTFLITNLISAALMLMAIFFLFDRAVQRAEAELEREYNRAEELLHNILPETIALRLKNGERLIADEHDEVSVLFADIVNFTGASAKLKPHELVETLNLVFTEFDRLSAEHGAEKIKTIGDSYMSVLGLGTKGRSHARAAVALALDMLTAAKQISAQTHFPIELRIGINSGSVVAGVIGENKFAYDLWGDAVNVAARMESVGEAGQIVITEKTRNCLGDSFSVAKAGEHDVKGKGRMTVFTVS